MIIQHSNLLLEIITKIELMINAQKIQQPNLSDEEIIDKIKNQLRLENNR